MMTTRRRKNIIYITNSIFMAITVILLCASIFCMFTFEKGTNAFTLSRILFFIFLCICLLESFSIAYRMIYIDQDVRIGNATYVMQKAVLKNFRKKLYQYATLYINIKEFKYINQRYGLDNGDEVIRLYSKYLAKFVRRNSGSAGRLGGDNYFIFIKKDRLPVLLDYLSKVFIPVTVNGQETQIHVKCRCGIYELDKTSKPRTLIFYPSIAISNAREYLSDIVYFDSYMLENFTKEKLLIADSKKALIQNEFVPYYQPKVDVKTGKLSGCEALIRWVKEDKIISPIDFIPALEKAGAIIDVDYRVFELVCIDIYNWLDAGITPVRTSVNFSKIHLKDPAFIKKLIEIKDKYKIDGKYLEIELTESAGIIDFSVIQSYAAEIKKAGMKVSIDDFGTGYSSLSMLQSIPADVVKMDKSFLDNSFKDGKKQFIIDVINIVKHQGEEVLFEGVETKEQLDFLRENNCDTIQGYYFDKPLPLVEFQKRLVNPVYRDR